MTKTWVELALLVSAADEPNIELERLISDKVGVSRRVRFTDEYAAARSVYPLGWGLVLNASPNRRAYCDAIGPVRVSAEGASEVLAVLAAGLHARHYLEGLEARRATEMARHLARYPQAEVGADAP